jgi:hypothetical protein
VPGDLVRQTEALEKALGGSDNRLEPVVDLDSLRESLRTAISGVEPRLLDRILTELSPPTPRTDNRLDLIDPLRDRIIDFRPEPHEPTRAFVAPTSNTRATEENTAALRSVSQAIERGIGTGKIHITIEGGEGLDPKSLTSLLVSEFGTYLRSCGKESHIDSPETTKRFFVS